MKKTFVILTGNNELNISIKRFLHYVFNINKENIFHFTFESSLTPEILNESDIWIIEGFNPEEPSNPVGWRTAKKLNKKVLVIFLSQPKNLNLKESYFFTFSLKNFKEKIENVIKNEPPKIEDFEKIEEKWKELKYEPGHHHHH